jgi:hypothetical protein
MDIAWMQQLLMTLSGFVNACCLKAPTAKHARGYFAQVILGMAHGMGENKNVCNCLQVWPSIALLTIHG